MWMYILCTDCSRTFYRQLYELYVRFHCTTIKENNYHQMKDYLPRCDHLFGCVLDYHNEVLIKAKHTPFWTFNVTNSFKILPTCWKRDPTCLKSRPSWWKSRLCQGMNLDFRQCGRDLQQGCLNFARVSFSSRSTKFLTNFVILNG